MLEVVLTNIGPRDREQASKIAREFDQVSIKAEEDYSRDYGNLKFNCPKAITITQKQEEKFGEVLEKIFCYEKRSVQLIKDRIDYCLSEIAFKKPKMFLNYGSVRFYLENIPRSI